MRKALVTGMIELTGVIGVTVLMMCFCRVSNGTSFDDDADEDVTTDEAGVGGVEGSRALTHH